MNIPKNIVDASVKATVLKRKIAALVSELDECKDIIRPWAVETYATARAGNPELTMLEVPTSEGTLSVIFPRDKADFVKGKNIEALLIELVPMKADLIVKKEFVIAKGFYDSWTSVDSPFTKTEKKLVERYICFKEQTPRIEPAK